jgi:hypothetical protein
MNIYFLRADVNNYKSIIYTDDDDIIEFNRRFNGAPLKKTWTSQYMFRFARNPRILIKGDTPGLSTHIPVFSSRAVTAVMDLLQDSGELLPIVCDDEYYSIFNVTRVVDALDEPKSKLRLFSDGKIMDIDRHAFFPEKLKGIHIFKIPQSVLMDVFITDTFVDIVKTAGLKGFEFRPVWSSKK